MRSAPSHCLIYFLGYYMKKLFRLILYFFSLDFTIKIGSAYPKHTYSF